MGSSSEVFNHSGFSRFINSTPGRIFRIVAGIGFLILGFLFIGNVIGIISLVWSIFPLSAGLFDICYISAVLGGPLSGKKIRNQYKTE